MALLQVLQRLFGYVFLMIIIFLTYTYFQSISSKQEEFVSSKPNLKQLQTNETRNLSFTVPRVSEDCRRLCFYSSIAIHGTVKFNSSHYVRHFPNFVCPQNFRNLADWVYGWPEQLGEHLEKTTDDLKRIVSCLPSGSIIYVWGEIMNQFFSKVYPHIKNNFVLITGNGVLPAPNKIAYLEASDSKIIHWFGQNGRIDAQTSKKFTHIPVGESK